MMVVSLELVLSVAVVAGSVVSPDAVVESVLLLTVAVEAVDDDVSVAVVELEVDESLSPSESVDPVSAMVGEQAATSGSDRAMRWSGRATRDIGDLPLEPRTLALEGRWLSHPSGPTDY